MAMPYIKVDGFDIADVLPEAAAAKLRSLRQMRDDAMAVLRPLIDKQNELREDKARHEARLRELQKPRGDAGFGLDRSAPQVIAEHKQLASVKTELARVAELEAPRTAICNARGALARNIEDYLRYGVPGNCALALHHTEPPVLKKGDSLQDAIEARRFRLRELAADAHRIRGAPYPSADAKAAMRSQIAALASQGAPYVAGMVETMTPIEFPKQRTTALVHNAEASPGAVVFVEAPDALATLAWLHHDALVAKLEAEISRCSDDGVALSAKERGEREAAVMADSLLIEREEAGLIWRAINEGIAIEFRVDTSPTALLGLRLVVTAGTAAPQGTSWMHSAVIGAVR